MKNTLEKSFRHHAWFKGVGLTVRQALEYFAANADFSLTPKGGKISPSPLLGTPGRFDNFLTDGRYTYRLTDAEYEYYIQRKAFWDEFRKKLNAEYMAKWDSKEKTPANYCAWSAYVESEKRKVPEYDDYLRAYGAHGARCEKEKTNPIA